MSSAMSSAVIPQASVIAAWADMKDWVEQTLPGQAVGTPLPDDSQNAGDIGSCYAFNQPGSAAYWGGDGDATVTQSGRTIVAMSDVQIQPAIFVDAATVQLPMGFSLLDVQGAYAYTQPCACYEVGKKISTATGSGHGALDQSVPNGTLSYVASCSDSLVITDVVVDGTPVVTLTPASGGLPAWVVAIANFFSTVSDDDLLRGSLQNVYTTAAFSQTMISMLNEKAGA
jgi:hypothetical protein